MKLIDDFFEVLETFQSEAGFSITIGLNPNHIVYAGHFPGHPVTPGVIQLQIVHELLERQFSRKLKLDEMVQCKFLKVLNPEETAKITIHLEVIKKEVSLMVRACGESSKDLYFKLSGSYHF